MSRTLARLRAATGDPLLVRAGLRLVATPRALELRERVGPFVEEANALLRPAERVDIKRLVRTFTLRTSDGFVENFGPALAARAAAEAPGIRLRFNQKPDKDSAPLRDGSVDLETGVVGPVTSPEIRTEVLFEDQFVGVVRKGHRLTRGAMTPYHFASGRHVVFSRGDDYRGEIDAALAVLGLERHVAIVVGGFAGALALAKSTDLIACVPERHTGLLRTGLHSFALPFNVSTIAISMLWHPRQEADPGHRWLRDTVRAVCATSPAATKSSTPPPRGSEARRSRGEVLPRRRRA